MESTSELGLLPDFLLATVATRRSMFLLTAENGYGFHLQPNSALPTSHLYISSCER